MVPPDDFLKADDAERAPLREPGVSPPSLPDVDVADPFKPVSGSLW